jgi:hypothetical protein
VNMSHEKRQDFPLKYSSDALPGAPL